MIKVGINGFGRIGRLAARIILTKYSSKIKIACINTSGRIDTSGWAHLFKYDSVYGRYPGRVSVKNNWLTVDDFSFPVLGELDPGKIPWSDFEVEVVIEATGVFRKEEDAKKHLRGTVKKVILSAPPKEGNIPMYIIGVNEKNIGEEKILSCGSCTTNCVAPITKVIGDNFGIKKAFLNTVHAYTSDQELLDGSHKDLRRGRAAAANIVPTSTGAAKSVAEVYPAVKGIFDGIAIRVPVMVGSLSDLTFLTKKKTSVEEVNQQLTKASQTYLKGILKVTSEPLVSSDIIGEEASAIVDLTLTNVIDGDLVKIFAWYDNEWAYSSRLVEEVLLVGENY